MLGHLQTKISSPRDGTTLSQYKNLLLHLLQHNSILHWQKNVKFNPSVIYTKHEKNTKKNPVVFKLLVIASTYLVWHSNSAIWKATNSNRSLHIKWQPRKSSLILFLSLFLLFIFLAQTVGEAKRTVGTNGKVDHYEAKPYNYSGNEPKKIKESIALCSPFSQD